jgi:hypothetical protein
VKWGHDHDDHCDRCYDDQVDLVPPFSRWQTIEVQAPGDEENLPHALFVVMYAHHGAMSKRNPWKAEERWRDRQSDGTEDSQVSDHVD